jgi:C1A family cysteine protease
MKKTLLLIALFSTMSWSIFGQNFVQVTQSDLQHQVALSQNQALEVRLPSTPTTGFGWYLKDNNQTVIKQVGNWEFISDNPENPIGSSGTQVNHFVTTASGTTDLELLYKRPWEDANQATASYKVTIISEGTYRGQEVKPYVPVDQSATVEKNETTLALPATFSWQTQNLCTPAKNQGNCGSCWAFAACGSFESVIKIWDNVTRDLSEQWLVNCTSSSNCSGGWCPDNMFKTKGAVYEADEKYIAANGTCQSTYAYHEKSVGYKELATNPTTDQIKQAIYDYGPVWACLCAGNNFDNYKSGVLTQSDGSVVNHAIVLCGWDDATSSWVLRNSWGTGWGENSGYMRIKWGISAVGYKATYIDYKGVFPHTTTGITNLSVNSSAQVFPNPSSGVFTISGLNNENSIIVYDLVGKQIYQTNSNNNSVVIELKGVDKGLYFYKATNGSTKAVLTGKILVD